MTASMLDLAAAYRAEGLRVEEMPGWQDRGHSAGPIRPVGGLWHHTADNSGVKAVMNLGGPDMRPDVPQPRCNVHVPRDRDGMDVTIVAAGLANHAGKGSSAILADIAAGRINAKTPDAKDRNVVQNNTVANAVLIGHEVENFGTGQPLTDRQLWAIPRIAAAECRVFGWTPGHHAHHRQYTDRKIDMFWRGDLWALTAEVLAHGPGEDWEDDMPDEATFKQWVREVLNEGTGDGQKTWAATAKVGLKATQQIGNRVTAVAGQVAQVAAQQAAVLSAAQHGPGVDLDMGAIQQAAENAVRDVLGSLDDKAAG